MAAHESSLGILPSFHHHHHHHQPVLQQQQQHYAKRWAAAPTIAGPPSLGSPAPVQPQIQPVAPPFSAAARLSALGAPSSSYLGAGSGRPAVSRRLRSDISEDEKQEIRMAFELFDTRKMGKLSYREVKVAMRALDFDVKKAEVKRLMEEHGRRGDSEEVDVDEFMEIMTSKYREKDPDEEISKAFRCFDEDGTGRISLKNLRKIARDVGEHITDEELGAMIDEFDKDGDGEISEAEFFAIMKKDGLED